MWKAFSSAVGLTTCLCAVICLGQPGTVRAGEDSHPPLVPPEFVPIVGPALEDLAEDVGFERGSCGSIVYSDGMTGTGQVNPIYNVSANFPSIYCGDDLTLAGTGRYVCEITFRLGTTNITQTPSFPYTFEFWDVATDTICPDSGAIMLYQSGTKIATGFQASIASIPFSHSIVPTVHVPNTFWVILRTTDTTENPFIRFRTGGGSAVNPQAPDVGQTGTGFYIGYNNNTCTNAGNMPHFVQYNGFITGFAIELQANDGPPGSCCTLTTGVCQDGVNQGDCAAYNQSWSQTACSGVSCAVCDITCTGSNLLENEPVCSNNYVDTINNGCSFDEGTESFINVSCGADICGTLGTYTFLNGTNTENRRDNDYYRLTLTNTRRVVWSVTAEAPVSAVIFTPRLGPGAGPCDDINTIAIDGTPSAASTSGCQAAVVDVCIPAGTYYLVARTSTTIGIPCGIPYRATVTCTACTLPTGACCLPAGCQVFEEVRCLQQGGAYRGDGTTCPPSPPCPPPPTNETCLTKSSVPTITSNTTIAIDTTFALTESTANLTECNNAPIFKDIWFNYQITAANQPVGVSFGRIAVSTYGTCFDTRLFVYRVASCGDSQTDQCANLFALICNDDVNTDRGDLSSYVEIEDNGEGVQPVVGECYKIRVGGAAVDQGGAGFLRVDFLPSGNAPWSDQSGRCCFSNGSCQITPGPGNPGDCASLGGFFTNTTAFGEGDANYVEYSSVGCHTLPCPAAGEACYNALNLHTNPGGGVLTTGFGTTTRAITNKLYYKYQIPTGLAAGSGITFSTCGSSYNTAIAVYSSFDTASGECLNDSTLIRKNDNCTASETSATGANGIATCFGSNEADSCLCISVGTIGQATGPGSTIFIEIGAGNTIAGSALPTIDPVPQNCGDAVVASLTVTASTACFVCSIPCPGGSIQENEPLCGPDYVDATDGGCDANPQVFKDVACGQTICGQSGTYLSGPSSSTARDTDWYRLVLTSAKTINLSLNSSFQSQLSILAAPNLAQPCTTTVIANITAESGCIQTNLTQPVCAGTFYIVVKPALLTGIDCGSPYTLSIGCGAAGSPNCCKGDMNNDGKVNGADIQSFIRTLINPQINLLPTDWCYNLNYCRADINGDSALTTADIPGFATLLLATGNCTALPSCTDPARCHLSDQSGGAVSDLGLSAGCVQRVADDFKVDVAGSIQNVCWYGSYLNFLTSSACATPGGSSPDNFCVTIYNDNGGMPGTVRGGPFCGVAVTKTDTGVDIPYTGFGNAREFRYSATLPGGGVGVLQNGCYWIEITNSTSGNCCWLWSLSGFTNNLSANRTSGPAGQASYTAADLDSGDFAFCLNDIRINKRDCGLPSGRCCKPDQTCTITDALNCVNILNGNWIRGQNCVAPCPLPIADNCANASTIPSVAGINVTYTGATLGFTTDGPVISCEATCAPTCNSAPDVWYKWTAPIGGTPTTFTLCPPGGGTDFDSILVVYTGTCTSLTEVPSGCNDDGCASGGPSKVSFTVSGGIPYLIRVTGYGGSAGEYALRITQP